MSAQLNSVEDTAKVLGKSDRWIRKLCENGKIKSVKVGKQWVVTADLDKLKDKHDNSTNS